MERQLCYVAEPGDAGRTVKEILRHELALSARQISRAKFLDGGITVNGEEVTVRRILGEGDVLSVQLEDRNAGSHQLIPQPGEPDIRYEDEDLILVNKPAGLVVHPSPGHYTDSLANILVWYYGQRGENLVVRPVGRLDRETSGLIYIAKHKAAVRRMELQRISGEMERHYLALVHGCPKERVGIIDAPIGPDPDRWMRQQVREDGAAARTAYRVREVYDGYSLVELHLFTGRTHQIRVHMAWLGHPLLGDSLYGRTDGADGSGGVSREYGMTRTALHSRRIVCTQPFTGQRLEFVSEPPEDMKRLIQAGKQAKAEADGETRGGENAL